MRVAIIGAGWFGCHLASALRNRQIDVEVFEARADVFLEASGFNQNRLHQGFHYPRSARTRQQITDGYGRFVAAYGNCVRPISDNVYAVAAQDSLLDFETYLAVMRTLDVEFEVCTPPPYDIANVEGALKCGEGLIDVEACRRHFSAELSAVLRTGHRVESVQSFGEWVLVDGEKFDFVLDCTYNHFLPARGVEVLYEVCLMLVYERREPKLDFALTVMDGYASGKFGSLYPYCIKDGKALYTLSSVRHTGVDQFTRSDEALRVMDKLASTNWHEKVRPQFEEVISHYIPWFTEAFTYSGEMWSMKTKLDRANGQTRECVVRRNGPVVHVFSGKISNVFFAEDAVCKALQI